MTNQAIDLQDLMTAVTALTLSLRELKEYTEAGFDRVEDRLDRLEAAVDTSGYQR